MKVFIALGVLFGFYFYFLTHTTDLLMQQLQHIQAQYSYVADHADQIASGN